MALFEAFTHDFRLFPVLLAAENGSQRVQGLEGASDKGKFEVDIRSFRVLVYTKVGLLERFTHDFCLFSVLLAAKNGSRRVSGPARCIPHPAHIHNWVLSSGWSGMMSRVAH